MFLNKVAWPEYFGAHFLFHDPPVFHVHEVPLQHFWQEFAIEALLAFHCKPGQNAKRAFQRKGLLPIGSLARTFACLCYCVLVDKIHKAIPFFLTIDRIEYVYGPKNWTKLRKMLAKLLLLQGVANLPEPESCGPHQHLQAELGESHLHWFFVHMVLGILEDPFARLSFTKPYHTIRLLDVIVNPPHHVALSYKAKFFEVILKDVWRHILSKRANIEPAITRKYRTADLRHQLPSLPDIDGLNFVREESSLLLLSWFPRSTILTLLFARFWRSEG